MSWLKRRPVPAIILGSSALGGAAYRFLAPSDSSRASLNPHTFTPYTLVDKQRVSSTSAIFTLRNSNDVAEPESVKEAWKRGVWSVQIKQPQLQIARAYTPLPPISDGERGDDVGGAVQNLRLLIRQETGGEVSTYLHRLPASSTVELRGPHTELELPDDIREVVFLAGGTGIAPAMQIARVLGRIEGSRMDIVWANRRREECIGGVSDGKDGGATRQSQSGWFKSPAGSKEPAHQIQLANRYEGLGKGVVVKELEALKTQGAQSNMHLSLQYCVDEERTFIQPTDIARRIDRPRETPGSRLVIVSGPEGFLEHWAGKKVWAGGREVQGPLGGHLGRMNLGDWKVIKL
ncbi:hypothetical protein J1614_000247 [Plenodomus biglobosus]|nr:hypothetical protein J1614_000247 [Plenodomus biglobosus]